MHSKFLFYELKNRFFYSKNWLIYSLYLIINLAIFPILFNNNTEILGYIYCAILLSSLLLIANLLVNNYIKDDLAPDYLDQLKIFKIDIKKIFLSSVVICSLELMLILLIAISLTGVLYNFQVDSIVTIYLSCAMNIPSIIAICLFGSLITLRLGEQNIASLLITLPLSCSILILQSMIIKLILIDDNLALAISYLKIGVGLSIIYITILTILSGFLD